MLMKVGENMNESEHQGLSDIEESMDQPLLTVKEAGQHVGESAAVIRNWMSELKNHIPTIRGENNYHYFDSKALDVLILIKKLSREQNYSIKQINHYFNSGGESFKPEVEPAYQEKMFEEFKFMREQFEMQQQFNQVLVEKLEQQQRYIEETLIKKNDNVVEALRLIQQSREEVAAVNEQPKNNPQQNKGWFARLFSR